MYEREREKKYTLCKKQTEKDGQTFRYLKGEGNEAENLAIMIKKY